MQADYPSMYFCNALKAMGPEAAPAIAILLDLLSNGEPRNRLKIALALAYIAPDDERVVRAILPILTRSLVEKGWAEQNQVTAVALAKLRSRAKPAVGTLRTVGAQRIPGAHESELAVRLIEAPKGGQKAVLSTILADPKSPLWFAVVNVLISDSELRTELRPELEALSKRNGLDPYVKAAIDRLLKMPSSGLINPLPF